MGEWLQFLGPMMQQGDGSRGNYYNNPNFGYGAPPTQGQDPFAAFYAAMETPAPAPVSGGAPAMSSGTGVEKAHFPGTQIDLTKDPRDSPLDRGPMFTVRNPYNLPDDLNDFAIHPTSYGQGAVRYAVQTQDQRNRLLSYGVPAQLISGGGPTNEQRVAEKRRRQGGGSGGDSGSGGMGGGSSY